MDVIIFLLPIKRKDLGVVKNLGLSLNLYLQVKFLVQLV